jgi:membrane protein
MTMTDQALTVMQVQVKRGKRLARHVWIHFREDRCLEEAASLGYTSLLALVPFLAVVFGIVAAFPVFSEWSDKLQSFIFENFMPATGEQIVPYIETFLDSVSSLTLPGTIFLVASALLLMIRIETALNRIWRVDRNRTLLNRVVMYWAVLTLAPILIGAALALSAQKVLEALGLVGEIPQALQQFGIFLLSLMVFTMMFVLVPNRRVQIKHALTGAFLSAVLFEIAKAGFVAWVSNANYKVIYGAVATVPIFLVWLYLVWTVILFGASLAASLTTFSEFRRYESDWPRRLEFQLFFRIVGHLWEAQREGRSLSRAALLELEPRASEQQVMRLLSRLKEARITSRDEEGDWMLARDLDDLSLGRLYQLGDYYLPVAEVADLPRDSVWDQSLAECLEQVRNNAKHAWDRPLRSLYGTGPSTGERL